MEKWNEAGAVNEVGALLEVAAEMMERLGITPAESLHRAIARRVWTSLGPLAMPTRTGPCPGWPPRRPRRRLARPGEVEASDR